MSGLATVGVTKAVWCCCLQAISNKEIDDSVDRIVAGMEGKPLMDGKAKSLVAYHEVGHAICGTLTPGHDPVQKVCAGSRWWWG